MRPRVTGGRHIRASKNPGAVQLVPQTAVRDLESVVLGERGELVVTAGVGDG
jgi:hypothetical protein